MRESIAGTGLVREVKWQALSVSAGLAQPRLEVKVGHIGSKRPIGVVIAGVHGDEGPWGALAIHKMLARVESEDLLGSLRIVPVANPLAMAADSRNAPLDGVNLNDAFPGDAHGSHTERLAAALTDAVITGADVVLDVHGGGSWNINCFIYYLDGCELLAQAMMAPLLVRAAGTATSLTGFARGRGACSAWIEMGGRGSDEMARAAAVATSLESGLRHSGVLKPRDQPGPSQSRFSLGKTRVVTTQAGVYVPAAVEENLGEVWGHGRTIGALYDLADGRLLEEYTAPYERTFLALLRPSVAVVDGPGLVVAVVHNVAK